MVTNGRTDGMSVVAGVDSMPTYEASLTSLLAGVAQPLRDLVVTGLTMDSRQAVAGCAFLACQGRGGHGISHAASAVERGAVAVLFEPVPGLVPPLLPAHVAVHAIPELGRRVGEIADRFFRRPSSDLEVVGVTGTNGKTTTAYLLAQAAEAVGRKGAYLGTIGFGRPGALAAAGLTTPDCVTVHRLLAEARDSGAKTVALEVSSHALDQGRVDAVCFDTAVFTNLTRDHLDYHLTIDAYFEAKARIFRSPGLRRAIVNVRDEFGRRLADALDPAVEPVFFSTSNDVWAPHGAAWIRLPELRATAAGLTLHVESSWGAGTLRSPLVGEFNAENLLAVLGVLLGWKIPLQRAIAALATCVPPPGRMEAFGGGAQPLVLVDYAHTPDALGKLLDAARAHTRGRVHCVFGCGGDRDPGKRPMMGAIAEHSADVVIVTDDNPRTEDSRAIIEQILAGMRDPGAVQVIADRAEAIHHALTEADAGDVVVIAGKGHEENQLVGGELRPFSDRQVVKDALGSEA